MENMSSMMSNETLHRLLSQCVSEQITNNQYDLSNVEWVRLMNNFSQHVSVQTCADDMRLSYKDVMHVYYMFTMYLVRYAMEHPQ